MTNRIMYEKIIEDYPSSFFVTLTYDDSHIPLYETSQGEIVLGFDKSHLQTFHHSLRKYYKFRFFVTCEYGEQGYRPHYHAIYFVYDKVRRPEFLLTVQRLWHYGFVKIGSVSKASIQYCTSYALKDESYFYEDYSDCPSRKPFRLFSLKPGLGCTERCIDFANNYLRNEGEYRRKIRLDNRNCRIPRTMRLHLDDDIQEFLRSCYDELQQQICLDKSYKANTIGHYALVKGHIKEQFISEDVDMTRDKRIKRAKEQRDREKKRKPLHH